MFANKNGSDKQRWSIQDSGNGALKITGFNSKSFGPYEDKLVSLNRIVLQDVVKPSNTWILKGV